MILYSVRTQYTYTMCLMEQIKMCSMPCHKSKGKRLIHQLIPKATVWDVGL